MVAKDFTIAFWLKTTDTGNTGQWWNGRGLVDGEVQGAADDFGVSLVGGHIALGAGTPDVTVTTTNAVNDGLWHHIAATREAADGGQRVYVDGTLQASGHGPLGLLTAPPHLRIGGTQAGYADHYLNGTIDDVQVFGIVFGPSEIAGLMNHPPAITSTAVDVSILAGRTLVITNSATDPDLPAQSLAWSLLSSPAGATVNSANGIVTWRPSVAQSPSTQLLSIRVADDGVPGMAATQSVAIHVGRPQSPLLSPVDSGSGVFALRVSGDAGPDYILQACTNLNLAAWIPVYTNFSASPPFEWTDPGPRSVTQKYFRMLLAP